MSGINEIGTATVKAKTVAVDAMLPGYVDIYVASYEEHWTNNIAINEKGHIRIYDAKKQAKYTYYNSNKKVVSVTKDGIVTGKKAGKAKITVKETYKKKTKIFSTVTVTVKTATLDEAFSDKVISSQTGYWKSKEGKEAGEKWFGIERVINYPNKKAVYKVYSSDSRILKVKTDGTIQDACGEGKVTLTFKETYNKKTRTIGKYIVEVRKPALKKNTILLEKKKCVCPGNYITGVDNYLFTITPEIVSGNALKADWKKLAEMKEKDEYFLYQLIWEDDVFEYVGSENGYMSKKSGTEYLYYGVYNYETNNYETLGYITINAKWKDKVDKISMFWEKKPGRYDSETGYEMEAGRDEYFTFSTEPSCYDGGFTVEIEKPDILSCDNVVRTSQDFRFDDERIYETYGVIYETEEPDEEEQEYTSGWDNILVLHPHKPGVTNVTIHANGASKTFKVNVYEARTYKKNQFGVLPFNCVIDDKELVEPSGGKAWRFESSDSEIVTVRDYSGGEWDDDNCTMDQVIMDGVVYFDTHRKEGDVTISAYYNDKLVGQKRITVKNE